MIHDKMSTQGAEGTDTQFGEILDYLILNFRKPINVNLASAKSLEAELELSTKEAEAIVAYRERNGAFKSVEELKKVPGLDAKKVEAARDWLAFYTKHGDVIVCATTSCLLTRAAPYGADSEPRTSESGCAITYDALFNKSPKRLTGRRWTRIHTDITEARVIQ